MDRYLEFVAGRARPNTLRAVAHHSPVPALISRLLGALRTDRDRAMVLAMLLAGLRRCEVLGLRFDSAVVRTE